MKKSFIILVVLLITTNVFAQVKSIVPDSIFGTNGVLFNNFDVTYKGTPFDMAVQTDGKIIQVIEGTTTAVRRFFANGKLDTTFGVNGYTVLPYDTPVGSVKVLTTGKILVCCGPIANYGCYLARLTSGGIIDSTFGTNGLLAFGNVVHPDWGRTNKDPDIKVLSDNSIRLVFTNFGLLNDTAMIIKIDSGGVVDNSFGTDGRLTITQTVWDACSFVLDHNDRIVMVTQSQTGYIMATRILPNGSIDNTFGNSGYNILPDPTQTSGLGLRSVIAIGLPDNSIVVLLNYSAGSRFSFAIHIKADGTQDMNYGLNGLATVDFFWTTTMVSGIALENGDVLISGQASSTSTYQTYACQLTILNTVGKTDSVFANHQLFTYFQYDTNYTGSLYTIAGPLILLPGNKILQAGSTRQSLTWLSRYNYYGFGLAVNETKPPIDFSLYPNPAANQFTIVLANSYKKVEISISDFFGKIVYRATVSEKQKIEVNTKNFAKGVYFIEIRTNEVNRTVKKLVKK